MNAWCVIQDANPRRANFAVHAKFNDGLQSGQTLLWEGEAPSREAAWEQAVLVHARLVDVPMPGMYQRTGVLSRLKPKVTHFSKPKRVAKEAPPREAPPDKTPSIKDRIFQAITAAPNGVTCRMLEDSLEIDHRTMSMRLRALKSGGRIEMSQERPFLYWAAGAPRPSVPQKEKAKAKRQPRRTPNPRQNGNTKRFRDAILAYAKRQGTHGYTLDEVRDYILAKIIPSLPEEDAESNYGGSVGSRHAELVLFGFVVPHPEGLRRPSGRGRQMRRVFVFTPAPVLFNWVDWHEDLRIDPLYKPIFEAIGTLREALSA